MERSEHLVYTLYSLVPAIEDQKFFRSFNFFFLLLNCNTVYIEKIWVQFSLTV